MTKFDACTFIGGHGADLALVELDGPADVQALGNGTNGVDIAEAVDAADVAEAADIAEADPGGTPTGSGFLHGDSVRAVKTSSAEVSFDPQFVCALYIRYENNGRPNVRHAYKALTSSKTDEVIRDTAEYILKDLRDDDYHEDVIHVRRNFNNFTMNCQQVLVLFLDNDPAIIRMNDDEELEHLIRFSPFSGVPPYSARKKNFAFYNLTRLTMTKGEFQCNKAYRLDFWNTDETEAPLALDSSSPQEEHYAYSMNIHLLQAPYEPDEVAAIPVILDPDTGNMGAEP